MPIRHFGNIWLRMMSITQCNAVVLEKGAPEPFPKQVALRTRIAFDLEIV